jgi:transposase
MMRRTSDLDGGVWMAGDDKMDVHLDVSRVGYAGRLEVIEGPTGRQRRSEAERARIVAESLLPGARVSEVARKHGATRWQIYDWRKRLLRDGRLALPQSMGPAPAFAAVMVEDSPQQSSQAKVRIEIAVGDIVIRTDCDVDGKHLSQVIRAVRAAI